MAARQNSSNGPDLTDITHLVTAFQEINQVEVKVTIWVEKSTKGPELCASAEAWGEDLGKPAAKLSALVSLRCSVTRLATLASVVTHLLYMLDAKLAWQEMDANHKEA